MAGYLPGPARTAFLYRYSTDKDPYRVSYPMRIYKRNTDVGKPERREMRTKVCIRGSLFRSLLWRPGLAGVFLWKGIEEKMYAESREDATGGDELPPAFRAIVCGVGEKRNKKNELVSRTAEGGTESK